MDPSSNADSHDAKKYRVPLVTFLAEARVDSDDLVEMSEPSEPSFPDPRGEAPDRDWFAAGG